MKFRSQLSSLAHFSSSTRSSTTSTGMSSCGSAKSIASSSEEQLGDQDIGDINNQRQMEISSYMHRQATKEEICAAHEELTMALITGMNSWSSYLRNVRFTQFNFVIFRYLCTSFNGRSFICSFGTIFNLFVID